VTAPEGFVRAVHGDATLIADARRIQALVQAGFDRPESWRAAAGSARGETGAAVTLAPDCTARIKQLRRGGWTASLWRDAFAGLDRPLDNLRLPLEAARRGVATPAPIALWIEPCCRGFVRAWLAFEEAAGARDLRGRLGEGLKPALAAVRKMHDLGVEHRDLNLGNLLVAGDRAWVIDLDRARLHDAPLGFAARQRALRRLERSYVKLRHPDEADPAVRDAIYDGYAGDDAALASRLRRGRAVGRAAIAIHRLGWGG
jgi:hypothetical protein